MIGVVMMIYTSQNTANLFSNAIKSQLENNIELREKLLSNTEDIVVYTVGTSAPFPSNRAQSCTAVFVNGKFFIFDIGYGSVQKLENLNLPMRDIEQVFLTHLHSDHYIDLPYLINRSWQLGRDEALRVTGPVGTNAVTSATKQLLAQENQYRVHHHGADIMDISVSHAVSNEIIVNENSELLVYTQDGIKITAFDVGHEPVSPDFGYKIEYNGKKCVLSGDTNKNQNVQTF